MSQEERQRKKEEQQAKEAAAQVGEAACESLSRSILLITCSNRRLSALEVRVSFDRICLEISQGEFDDISKKKTYFRGYLRLKVNGRKLAGQRGFRVLISRNAESYKLHRYLEVCHANITILA